VADFVNTTTLAVELSVNDKPAGWVTLTRAEAEAALAIPGQYRKWTGSAVAEMTAPEKAAVDAAAAVARAAAIVTSFDANSPPGVFRCVIKPSVTTRTATTVLADDPHLTFPVAANASYVFEYRIFFDTTAAGDFKLALTGPASPTGIRFYRSCVAPGATAFSSIGVSTALGSGLALTGTGTTGGYCEGRGILLNGANAGNVTVQWAQNTSDAGSTSVLTGSTLHWARTA
jgi:hypothetical protein